MKQTNNIFGIIESETRIDFLIGQRKLCALLNDMEISKEEILASFITLEERINTLRIENPRKLTTLKRRFAEIIRGLTPEAANTIWEVIDSIIEPSKVNKMTILEFVNNHDIKESLFTVMDAKAFTNAQKFNSPTDVLISILDGDLSSNDKSYQKFVAEINEYGSKLSMKYQVRSNNIYAEPLLKYVESVETHYKSNKKDENKQKQVRENTLKLIQILKPKSALLVVKAMYLIEQKLKDKQLLNYYLDTSKTYDIMDKYISNEVKEEHKANFTFKNGVCVRV